MLIRFIVICLFVGFGLNAQAQDPIAVKVGGYEFPPFLDLSAKNSTGMTIDLIRELNTFQKKYKFEFFITSPQRRYQAFRNGLYDIIFFENILWDWQGLPVDASKVFLTGGEVYITKASPGKDQTYFENLEGKSKAGILGYHYGFADFNATPEILKQTYQTSLYTDHKLMLDKIITGQIDIAVVTDSYLSYYLKANPAHASKLLISKKYDQKYRHTVLIRKGIQPDVNEFNQLLDDMKHSGILKRIWEKYGIQGTDNPEAVANTLTIGVSFAIPPYVIKKTGQGIELEILKEAFAVTGYTVEIEYLPLVRTFTQLEKGMIDGVINIKEGMLDNVFYSDEVIAFQNCAISLSKKNYPDFKDLFFLRGKDIVAFQRAPAILGEEFAKFAAGNNKYEEVAEQDRQIFRLFLERSADFVIMEKQIFNYYRKQALKDKTIGDKAKAPVKFHTIFPPTHYRFAFKNQTVRDAFNHGLKTIRENQKYANIIAKYEDLMLLD